MDLDDVKVIWGMVVTGATGVFFAIRWVWTMRLRVMRLKASKPTPIPPDKPHFLNANHAMIKIYRQLSQLQFKTQAGKVVVCRAHNGGSIPTVKGPMYVTTMFDVSSDIAPEDGWDRVRMDKQYHTMMQDLYLHKVLIVDAQDSDSGIFKAGMKSVDAKTCAFVEVLMTPEEYVFVAAIFLKKSSELDETLEYYLRIAATNLAKILKTSPSVSRH